ncbi:MAG TPA: MmgE/PrpD family protein [Candidatus Sulfotelmatobacter sp.]|nr:MmgE/PrpD family protein [Candidatus Sulfotelmatobacter sp.]
MSVTSELARYVVEARPDALPDAVRREAMRAVLHLIGCAIGGCRHATVEAALAALGDFAGKPQAGLVGRRERLDVLNAALIDGIASHVLDFDDTHATCFVHPSGPVACALLPLAEYVDVSGADFLNAFVLGVEVECRIAKAVIPAHYEIGWHLTGTAGVFGAAAAAGKLLGLDRQRMVWALGIAATQSAGLRESFGSMCKSLHSGRAAQNGLSAALLARQGFTAAEQGIEGKRGFAHVTSTTQNFAAITDGLGQSFELMRNTYKPFACGLVVHPTIDACLRLRAAHGLTEPQIERVDVAVHPIVLELTAKRTPRTGLEGKFSVFHSAAIALIDGDAQEPQYSDARVTDPAVAGLTARVQASADPKMHKEAATVTVTLRDGRRVETHVAHAVGSLQHPMSDAQIDAKVRGLAADVIGAERTEALIALCRDLWDRPDAGAAGRAAAAC